MIDPCDDLQMFADRELDTDRAAAFRAHLQTCEACQSALPDAMQFRARFEEPSEHPSWSWCVVRRWLRRWLPVPPVAAAVALLAFWPTTPVNVFASLTNRPHDVRFAYHDAADYLPYSPNLGSSNSSSKRIPHSTLADLERDDRHALALAMVWNGENLRDAIDQLRDLTQTEAVRSDRAAIEILSTSNDNLEPVLTTLEVLQRGSDRTAVRAARWNYALLLARLGLTLSAEKAFQAIAKDDEPGWVEEAKRNAESHGERASKLREEWKRAVAAGMALRATGAPVPDDLVKAVPGVLRTYFYNAVRTAPTAARVRALAPLAAELDRIAGTRILGDYVERVGKLDFGRRAPLAEAYRRLLDGENVTGALGDQLTTPTRSPEIIDIVLGAMVELDQVAANLEGARAMVKQLGDPWFEIILARAEAATDIAHNDWVGAEGHLKRAEKRCSSEVTYQCLALAHDLGALYMDLHRVRDALDVLQNAVGRARSAGEWIKLRQLLADLADAERFHTSTATARVYANEVLLMTDGEDCETQAVAHRILTGAALLDVDGPAARHHIESALRCGPPSLITANYLTDVGRLDPRPGDLALLQGWLNALRTDGKRTPAELAFTDEIEGRLRIERDRPAGITKLEQAIAAARQLPRDVLAEKVRAGAYSVLILDAARAGDHARALNLMAESLGLPSPGACTVGIHAEDGRAVVIVRDAAGTDAAMYEPRRSAHAGTLAVPSQLSDRLTRCTRVSVVALAGAQGQPGLLPPTLAWSYVTGARHEASRAESGIVRSSDPAGSPSILVVKDVSPPPELGLLPLSAHAAARTPATQTLSGSAATPTRVLAAMHDAREIQFHTHALVDLGVSDASHLVLSPDTDGKYALTAEAIQGATLRGAPIIVLAACRSAQGARYQHAPWSLPNALLSAGARAVFAAATEIPDLESGQFFERVLQRVRDGAAPAAALRDERMASSAASRSKWVASVMLFE